MSRHRRTVYYFGDALSTAKVTHWKNTEDYGWHICIDVRGKKGSWPILRHYFRVWGTRWRSWLRHCTTSREVAGSILPIIIGEFLYMTLLSSENILKWRSGPASCVYTLREHCFHFQIVWNAAVVCASRVVTRTTIISRTSRVSRTTLW